MWLLGDLRDVFTTAACGTVSHLSSTHLAKKDTGVHTSIKMRINVNEILHMQKFQHGVSKRLAIGCPSPNVHYI